MPAVQRLVHQLHAGFQLGIRSLIILEKQLGAAAQLPQLCQLRQNGDPVLGKLLLRLLLQKELQPLFMGFIEPALLARKLHRHSLLRLLGKLLEHILFQTPQHKGMDHPTDPVHRILVLLTHDRQLKLRAEAGILIEEARHQIVKNAPELTQFVLDRRPGERRAEAAVHQTDGFRGNGHLVLDILCLIDDLIRKRNPVIQLHVPLEQVVGGDPALRLLLQRPGDSQLPLLGIPADNGRHQLRGVLFDFLFPVVNQRSRRDNEGAKGISALSVLLLREQEGQYLQGFSESHIVGQNAAEAVCLQSFQPPEALLLVIPENGLQECRYFKLGILRGFHAPEQRPVIPALRIINFRFFPQQIIQVHSPEHRNPDMLLVLSRIAHGLGEGRPDILLPLPEGYKHTALEPVVTLLPMVRRKDFRKLLTAEDIGMNGHLQKAAGERHAHRGCRKRPDPKLFQVIRDINRTDFLQRGQPVVQELKDLLLIPVEKERGGLFVECFKIAPDGFPGNPLRGKIPVFLQIPQGIQKETASALSAAACHRRFGFGRLARRLVGRLTYLCPAEDDLPVLIENLRRVLLHRQIAFCRPVRIERVGLTADQPFLRIIQIQFKAGLRGKIILRIHVLKLQTGHWGDGRQQVTAHRRQLPLADIELRLTDEG